VIAAAVVAFPAGVQAGARRVRGVDGSWKQAARVLGMSEMACSSA
jgi:ABC-type molybdate transport system permease subunit